jgi:hypothetical protein
MGENIIHMGYEYEEEEYEEDFEEDYEDDEEEEVYHFVRGVERRGNVIAIKVEAADVCCPVSIEITAHDALKLVRELSKVLNKDEIKQLFSILVDVVTTSK